MPKIFIERSIQIEVDSSTIFNIISDFNHWLQWSPWLIMDPETEVTVRSDGKYYSWKGNRIGEGNMKITDAVENSTVSYDLLFLKPWKSKAKVSFHIEDNGHFSQVKWTMQSGLPFFLFWMKRMTEAFLGMDYERGLNMLKEYAEEGQIKTKLRFKGKSNFKGFHYVGIERVCSKEDLDGQITANLAQLSNFLADKKDKIIGAPFAIYAKWDMVNNQIAFTTGIPVSDIKYDLVPGITFGSIPSTSVYTIEHKGAYKHLGNAWSTLNSMVRSKEFKWDKKIYPFEVYLNDPKSTLPEDLLTAIHFPLKD